MIYESYVDMRYKNNLPPSANTATLSTSLPSLLLFLLSVWQVKALLTLTSGGGRWGWVRRLLQPKPGLFCRGVRVYTE
jgi:hypothetical protein